MVKFGNGSRAQPVVEDPGKQENSMSFSEETSRTIHGVGSIESSGKHGWGGFSSGETETDEFGVKEPPECEEKSSPKIRVIQTAWRMHIVIRVAIH